MTPVPYRVWLTDGAEQMLRKLQRELQALALEPERGSFPRELQAVGNRDFRQVQLRPYRLVYRVFGCDVFVVVIADGRRDIQTLLQRRLLSA